MKTRVIMEAGANELEKAIIAYSEQGWVLISNNVHTAVVGEIIFYHVVMQKPIPKCNG